MKIGEIQAKVLMSHVKEPDPWFGRKYSMNLFRGCVHRCVCCDSRSLCHGIEDFDGEMLVKANALELLSGELARKHVKGYIGTNSMNDPDFAPAPNARELETVFDSRAQRYGLQRNVPPFRPVERIGMTLGVGA